MCSVVCRAGKEISIPGLEVLQDDFKPAKKSTSSFAAIASLNDDEADPFAGEEMGGGLLVRKIPKYFDFFASDISESSCGRVPYKPISAKRARRRTRIRKARKPWIHRTWTLLVASYRHIRRTMKWLPRRRWTKWQRTNGPCPTRNRKARAISRSNKVSPQL